MPFNAAECEDKMDEKTASKRRDWVKNAAKGEKIPGSQIAHLVSSIFSHSLTR